MGPRARAEEAERSAFRGPFLLDTCFGGHWAERMELSCPGRDPSSVRGPRGGEASAGVLLFQFSTGPKGIRLPGPKLGIPWRPAQETGLSIAPAS